VAPVIQGLVAKDGAPEAENLVTKAPRYIPDYDTPRFRLTPGHTAYIKIAEGCNHPCSFCIIPALRGDLASRPAADVLREAEKLVQAGVKELLVVSQDTSAYGVDLKYAASRWQDREVRAKFVDLARELADVLARGAVERDRQAEPQSVCLRRSLCL
jgi:ribosomal protein S12 methylthiotransferase